MSATPPDESLKPRARALRYGVAVAVVIAGILCGAIIPGTLGGTICTAVVGVGLVGVVSLVFYDVGLTEDRDRARHRARMDRIERDERERGLRGAPHPGATRRIPGDATRLPGGRPRPRRTRIRDEHGRLN